MNKGKAFEYASAIALRDAVIASGELDAVLEENPSLQIARRCFAEIEVEAPEAARKLMVVAEASAKLLLEAEPKLTSLEEGFSSSVLISLQPDAAGVSGDVRDIVVTKRATGNGADWAIGLSCKHNNDAVKHQRLSPSINFGQQWLGVPLLAEDFTELDRIFSQIDADKVQGFADWNQIPNKEARYYQPLLQLVLDKIASNPDQNALAERLLSYLIGNEDFYKVIMNEGLRGNAQLTFQGFNFNGSLNQAALGGERAHTAVARLTLPNHIIDASMKPNSANTLKISFGGGWQVSMRIHSASTKLQKSLKMDVRLLETPPELFSQTVSI